MKVSVIIPDLNEAGTIESVLSDIPKESVDEILVAMDISRMEHTNW